MRELIKYYILEPSDRQNQLSILSRILLFPFSFILWIIYVGAFSLFGGFIVILLGIVILFEILYKYDKDKLVFGVTLILSPFLCPIIWWIRYWYHGEYGMVKGWEE